MRTAIFTLDKTTLTIQLSEAAQLVPMNAGVKPVPLKEGTNTITVDAGVFKVQSQRAVSVTTATGAIQIMATADDKDGDWPDPQKSVVTLSVTSVSLSQFFASGAKSL